MCLNVSFCKRCTKIGSGTWWNEIEREMHWNIWNENEMTQMYSKYVFAQDVFDLYKLEISNSQPWHTRTYTHTHTQNMMKKMFSCIENMAFVPKYAHDNFCIVHKWFFLLIFLLSLVRFKQLQCRKVFDNNSIECVVVHCKRSEPILFIMINIYLFHLYL